MIQIENVDICGWESAIRGMRNPMNSWDKSDSVFWGLAPSNESGDWYTLDGQYVTMKVLNDISRTTLEDKSVLIGKKDLGLMSVLSKAGTDHRKFMRMITVYCDILAPLYWWKEFDTYKVGTVANSCSTMHKIADKPFAISDFSTEHLVGHCDNDIPMTVLLNGETVATTPFEILRYTIAMLNECRDRYLKTKDKTWWWQMIQLLPSSYNQRRTVMMNYEVLANIYKSRRGHKLDEWIMFCGFIENLPYNELIIGSDWNDD